MTTLKNGSDLTGQVALVTGASRLQGIGAAICRALAAHGADIAFSHWRPYDAAFPCAGTPSEPDDLAHELKALGVRTVAIECDLSNPGAEVRLLDETESRLGPLSILINNAAYSTNDGYERLDAATIDAHYAVNMRAAMLLTAQFARRFAAGDGGRIINISSGQGSVPCQTSWPTVQRKGPSRRSRVVSPPRSRRRGSRSMRSIPVRPIVAGSPRSCATFSYRGSRWDGWVRL
jgi:3-oxoacyl-[acyl-carrier protein] reductase